MPNFDRLTFRLSQIYKYSITFEQFGLQIFSSDLNIKENLNGTATYPATCQEYFDRGTRANGTYKIRPSIDLHSYHVQCKFTKTEGITFLHPIDWRKLGYTFPANELERCKNADCYTKMINYGVNMSQIKVKHC